VIRAAHPISNVQMPNLQHANAGIKVKGGINDVARRSQKDPQRDSSLPVPEAGRRRLYLGME
jgi:hypothetical protein